MRSNAFFPGVNAIESYNHSYPTLSDIRTNSGVKLKWGGTLPNSKLATQVIAVRWTD